MKNILVPTDFSIYAESALEYAELIAKIRNSTIHLVSVVTSSEPKDFDETEKNLIEMKNKLVSKGLLVESHVKLGHSIVEQIINCAESINADLILMGSHGSSSISEILIGSNTENVVSQSHLPVLTIKHSLLKSNIQKIVFASDFSSESNRIFYTAKEFAEKFKAQIHLLKINTPSQFEPTRVSMEKINKFINNEKLSQLSGNKFKIALYSDSTEELGILNYCIEQEIDIIVLGTHSKSGFWKLLQESTSQNLVSHSFRPVLTIPIPE